MSVLSSTSSCQQEKPQSLGCGGKGSQEVAGCDLEDQDMGRVTSETQQV